MNGLSGTTPSGFACHPSKGGELRHKVHTKFPSLGGVDAKQTGWFIQFKISCVNHIVKPLLLIIIPFALSLMTTPLRAFVPPEELSYIDIAYNAEYLEVFRPFDNKKYKIRIGIGCMPALFDDLSKDTKIYAVKLGDLLSPYGDGDIGLIYIETPHHKVRCKILDLEPF